EWHQIEIEPREIALEPRLRSAHEIAKRRRANFLYTLAKPGANQREVYAAIAHLSEKVEIIDARLVDVVRCVAADKRSGAHAVNRHRRLGAVQLGFRALAVGGGLLSDRLPDLN